MSLLKKILQFPTELIDIATHSYEQYKYESNATFHWNQLEVDKKELQKIKQEVEVEASPKEIPTLSETDKTLVKEIMKTTNKKNLNNITRTNAYLTFFQNNMEVHWALLAHLVSRNGGWNMTDLKGSILQEVFTEKRRTDYFLFLERANFLIFHDAYPQLLLYEESKKRRKNLFYLLPYFGVSSFMKPIWEHFLYNQDSKLLTIALIINEQHYIEKPVIRNLYFESNVINTWPFQAQELLQFNLVLFPYIYKTSKIRLAGISVTNFTSISTRINVGKRLYGILFGIKPIFQDCLAFINNHPHSGSRSDYWPHIFTPNKGSETNKIYSPHLTEAWKDEEAQGISTKDWFKNTGTFHYFSSVKTPRNFDVTLKYEKLIKQMRAASAAYQFTDSLKG
ncbi:DUF2515 domain-containing protein [Bacillus sp. FJAT-45350]|uniref:DUF2515 domain-containing protein n=1 Tax=Bacillus sp. FJAT-45350 TaxID=2011014 RepID=UPI000BB7BF26|nr:DUF2515 domain-containing protein [Bacillus sp. FJAT-45350]